MAKLRRVERTLGPSIQRQTPYREKSAILARDKIAADVSQINKMMGRLLKRKTKKFIVQRRVRTIRRVELKGKRSARKDHRQLATTDAMERRTKTWRMKRRRTDRKAVEIALKLARRRKNKIWKVKLLMTRLEGPVQHQEPSKSKKRSSSLKRH